MTDNAYSYKPGDILIFHSAALWHMVQPWQPLPRENNAPCTPGRVSRVYTTHENTLKLLEREDWRDHVILNYR